MSIQTQFIDQVLPVIKRATVGNEVDKDSFQEASAHAWKMLTSGISPRASAFYSICRTRSGRTFCRCKKRDPLGNPTRQRPRNIIPLHDSPSNRSNDPALIVQVRMDYGLAIACLTPQERRILKELIAGNTFKGIGETLNISPRRVSAIVKSSIKRMLIETLGEENVSFAFKINHS